MFLKTIFLVAWVLNLIDISEERQRRKKNLELTCGLGKEQQIPSMGFIFFPPLLHIAKPLLDDELVWFLHGLEQQLLGLTQCFAATNL